MSSEGNTLADAMSAIRLGEGLVYRKLGYEQHGLALPDSCVLLEINLRICEPGTYWLRLRGARVPVRLGRRDRKTVAAALARALDAHRARSLP